MKDSLGDRQKKYELVSDFSFTARLPLVIRLDGKSFHTWVKKSKCVRPFDQQLIKLMQDTCLYLLNNISGARVGYTQSDEITIVLFDDMNNETQSWFDKRIQKICSISASLATFYFNQQNPFENKVPAFFDARAFCVPNEIEVFNNILWRQQDCIKNSATTLANSLFSHKTLQNKNTDQKIEMCLTAHNVDWNDLDVPQKFGSLYIKQLIEFSNEQQTYTRGKFVFQEKQLKEIKDTFFDLLRQRFN